MITIEAANSEDRNGWNLVANVSNGSAFFHRWEWLEIMENVMKYDVVKLLAREDKQIIGIFPGIVLPASRDKRLERETASKGMKEKIMEKYNILWSPPDTIAWTNGGPVALPGKEDCIQNLFIEMAKIMKHRKDILDWKISPMKNEIYEKYNKPAEVTAKCRPSLIIDLRKTEEELWHELDKTSHRNAIYQAKKKGVEIHISKSLDELKTGYQLLSEHAERIHMPLEPYEYYISLMKEFIERDDARFYLAKHENEIIGILIVMFHNGIAYPAHIAVPRIHSKLRASNYILWYSILDAKSKGMDKYDLSGMPGDPTNGIYVFKKGFGGEMVNFNWYQKKFKLTTIRKIMN